MKVCKKCNIEKPFDEFHKHPSCSNGIGTCKKCKYEMTREWIAKNQKKNHINQKNYRKSNLEKERKRKLNYYHKNKVRESLRNSIRRSFINNGFNKNNKTQKILGCSFEDFKQYIENQFEPWMNWENYGQYNGELNYGWDLDHIIPISSAKTEQEVIKLNHYTNFQPLCSKVNRDIKKDRLDYA